MTLRPLTSPSRSISSVSARTRSACGKPLSALLGAYTAQENLCLAAIGGKDSMSGSFDDMDVPPTLVSFAIAPQDACQRHLS